MPLAVWLDFPVFPSPPQPPTPPTGGRLFYSETQSQDKNKQKVQVYCVLRTSNIEKHWAL